MEAGPRDREQQEAVLGDSTGEAPVGAPGLTPDGPDDAEGTAVEVDADEVEVELRPQRRLRIWQIAPIVALAAVGSLMFAFPLAFGSGDGGAVLAMLGLLISSCAAGWGMMAARKVGYTWPGLPQRGSGERPDWRVLGLYVATIGVLVALAVWRVARLR
ncbi:MULTISPECIES: membrane protein [Streptomyces]|uniref:membrane protein n=1 Tax=Streptomyces TaxID=1883 RepID=UPI00046632A9|nr:MULTISPECIES: membrane protein [Streptomyces]